MIRPACGMLYRLKTWTREDEEKKVFSKKSSYQNRKYSTSGIFLTRRIHSRSALESLFVHPLFFRFMYTYDIRNTPHFFWIRFSLRVFLVRWGVSTLIVSFAVYTFHSVASFPPHVTFTYGALLHLDVRTWRTSTKWTRTLVYIPKCEEFMKDGGNLD